jgi:hypothetical protein
MPRLSILMLATAGSLAAVLILGALLLVRDRGDGGTAVRGQGGGSTESSQGRVPKYKAELVDEPRDCPAIATSTSCYNVITEADDNRSLALISKDLYRHSPEAGEHAVWVQFYSSEGKVLAMAYYFRSEAAAKSNLAENLGRRAEFIDSVYFIFY